MIYSLKMTTKHKFDIFLIFPILVFMPDNNIDWILLIYETQIHSKEVKRKQEKKVLES